MVTVEILTLTHTHAGVDLQRGARVQMRAATARRLVLMRIARIIETNPHPE